MKELTVPGMIHRLHSLDALRGLDMLFIIGLDGVFRTLSPLLLSEEGVQEIRRQMGHCPWDGLAFYDLIFPIFVFISGASMYYSFARAAEKEKKRLNLIAKLWKRALILSVFGCMVNAWEMRASLTWPVQFDELRYASVLGLIGISSALAGSAVIGLRRKWAAPILATAILVVVWCLQAFGGDMTPDGCLNAKVDAVLCPGVLYSGSYDPEGPLCIVSASALALMGYCAGWLSSWTHSMWRQAAELILLGGFCIVIGLQCGVVIKGIWTPSFVLVTGGIAYWLLAFFRLLCDGWSRGEKLSLPLRIVGMNALFIYLINHLPGYPQLCADVLLPIFYVPSGSSSSIFLASITQLGGSWLICYLLWKKGLFIKV